MHTTVIAVSDRYRAAIHVALFQQVPCAVLCLLLLDGGRMARLCGIALLGFWSAAAVMLARRPHAPAPSDLTFIRWGFLPLFALVVALARLV